MLRGFVGLCSKASNQSQARLGPSIREYFYKTQIFSCGTQPMVLFVGFAESFC